MFKMVSFKISIASAMVLFAFIVTDAPSNNKSPPKSTVGCPRIILLPVVSTVPPPLLATDPGFHWLSVEFQTSACPFVGWVLETEAKLFKYRDAPNILPDMSSISG